MCFCSAVRLVSRPPMASWWRWRASRSSASAFARHRAAALRADLLQLGLHAAGGLLRGRLLPLDPVELGFHLGQFGRQPGVGTGPGWCAATATPFELRPQLVVFLDETGELTLYLVKEGVDLLLVVPPLADRGLLECDVVDVGRGQRHRNSSGQLRPRSVFLTRRLSRESVPLTRASSARTG